VHPKDVLYNGVYDPLTIAWFAALAESTEPADLLAEAPRHDLVTNLLRFNDLFHRLVDISLNGMHQKEVDDIVAIVKKYRNNVQWMGHNEPGLDTDDDGIRASLSDKLKRNISLGVIEALICLESAYIYCDKELGLTGELLAETLRRSRQLYASLALLHDDQERERLTELTGVSGYLEYPKINYHNVINGDITIAVDKFLATGSGNWLRLRFVSAPIPAIPLDSPTKRCPAHRFRSSEQPELMLNDVLWDLLIEIYRGSGRFR